MAILLVSLVVLLLCSDGEATVGTTNLVGRGSARRLPGGAGFSHDSFDYSDFSFKIETGGIVGCSSGWTSTCDSDNMDFTYMDVDRRPASNKKKEKEAISMCEAAAVNLGYDFGEESGKEINTRNSECGCFKDEANKIHWNEKTAAETTAQASDRTICYKTPTNPSVLCTFKDETIGTHTVPTNGCTLDKVISLSSFDSTAKTMAITGAPVLVDQKIQPSDCTQKTTWGNPASLACDKKVAPSSYSRTYSGKDNWFKVAFVAHQVAFVKIWPQASEDHSFKLEWMAEGGTTYNACPGPELLTFNTEGQPKQYNCSTGTEKAIAVRITQTTDDNLRLFEVEIYGPPAVLEFDTNHKIPSTEYICTHTTTSIYPAHMACDGLLTASSFSRTYSGKGNWFKVAFPATNVASVKIWPESSAGNSFKLEWMAKGSTTYNACPGPELHAFNAVSGRPNQYACATVAEKAIAVRITQTTDDNLRLFEVEIYAPVLLDVYKNKLPELVAPRDSRHFKVNKDYTLQLSYLKLTCRSSRDGGITTWGNVYINGVHFDGYYEDSAENANMGGAIYVAKDGAVPQLAISNSLFEHFKAKTRGGAISATGVGTNVSIVSSTFESNLAIDTLDGTGGGAIFASGGVQLTVEDTTFVSNSAKEGGAVALQSTSETRDPARTRGDFTGCTFESNSATISASYSDGTPNEPGGGLYSKNSFVSLKSSTFIKNKGSNGGGMYIDFTNGGTESNPIIIESTLFSQNTATGTHGGAGINAEQKNSGGKSMVRLKGGDNVFEGNKHATVWEGLQLNSWVLADNAIVKVDRCPLGKWRDLDSTFDKNSEHLENIPACASCPAGKTTTEKSCPSKCVNCRVGHGTLCKLYCSSSNWCGSSGDHQQGGTDCRMCDAGIGNTADTICTEACPPTSTCDGIHGEVRPTSPDSGSHTSPCTTVSATAKPCCWAEWDHMCTNEHGSESVCVADGAPVGGVFVSGEWCPSSVDPPDPPDHCTGDTYQTQAPTATSNRACAPRTTCATNTYQVALPSDTSDRTCHACPTAKHSSAGSTVGISDCLQNVCTCATPQVVAASGIDCTTHEANICASCDPGEILSGSNCVQCTRGTAATGLTGSCEACPAGTYQNQHAATTYGCSKCIAGKYGDQIERPSMKSCKPCLAGRWSSLVGHGVTPTETACVACAYGKYNVLAAQRTNTCLDCGQGKYNHKKGSNAASSCQNCPAGTYSGTMGAISLIACKNCGRGKYSTAVGAVEQNTCIDCAKGTYHGESLPNENSKPRISYWAGKVNQHFDTRTNTWQTDPDASSGAGEWVDATKIPAEGTEVKIQGEIGELAIVGGGWYYIKCASFDGGGVERRKCSKVQGFTNVQVFKGSDKLEYCQKFWPNTTSIEQTATQETLAFCAAKERTCTHVSRRSVYECVGAGVVGVPKGSMSDSACIDCPMGTQQPQVGQATCLDCMAGAYSTKETGSHSCTNCPKGTYNEDGRTVTYSPDGDHCIKCTAGKYQDTTGADTQDECRDCEKYTYNPYIGQKACLPCIDAVNKSSTTCPGCNPGEFLDQDGVRCLTCALGFFTEDRNQPRCDSCPSGYHGKNVTLKKHIDRPVYDSCDACPRGFFGDREESPTLAVGCKACASGRFSTREGVSSARDTNNDGTICDACPSGKYSEETTGMAKDSACKFCKAGLYSTVEASNAVGNCKACVAGQYYDGVGANSNSMCKTCEAGKAQPSRLGEAYCLPCQPGKFQPHTGSATCQECLPNTKSEASNAIQCVNCSTGTESVTGSSKCLSCIAGMYNNRNGESCQACGRGQYRNNDMGADVCLKCPIGFYSKRKAQAFCLPCRAGAYNIESGMHACTSCKAGQFRDNFMVAAACASCPNGYYQKNQGSAECLPKTVGWILLGCLDHLECTDTSRCPVGTYQNDLRSTERCLQCPSGFSSTSGATECQSCNKGEYGVQKEEESVGLCHKCGIHQFQPHTGSVTCLDCPAGWNQPSLGSESCVDLKYKKPEECELVSQYLDNTDNDPLAWKCEACPNGAYCTGDTIWKDVVAKMGYWRVPWSNRSFERCPYHDDCWGKTDGVQSSATANTTVEQEGCIQGTMGPLCSICLEGYNRDGGTCHKCENTEVALRVGVLVAVVFVLYLVYLSCRRKVQIKWKKYKTLWRDFLRVVSINITFMQINSSLPHVLEVQWPQGWHRFVQRFSFVNIDVMGLVGIRCIGGYTYYLSFLIMVGLPVSIVLLTTVNYRVSKGAMEYRLKRLSKQEHKNMEHEALHSLFHLADSDHSGEIDPSELAGILKALGRTVTIKTAHLLVEKIDQVPNAHGVFLLNEEQFLDAMLTGLMQQELDLLEAGRPPPTKRHSMLGGTKEVKRKRAKTGLFDKHELVKWVLRKNIVANALSGATQLLMLAHTPVSRKVFLYFDCNDLAGVLLLRADYTIDCNSDDYTAFMPVVVLVLFGFIVALPGTISCYLYRNRQDLYSTSVYQKVGWLYDPFVRGAEWWQIHDVLLKMVLTGMLIYVPPLSRAGIAVLVCFVACCNLNYFTPHKNKVLFWLTELSFIITTAKYVVSLLLSSSRTADQDEQATMSVFLIALDVFFLASSVVAIGVSVFVLATRVVQINREEEIKEEVSKRNAAAPTATKVTPLRSKSTVRKSSLIEDAFTKSEVALVAEQKRNQQKQRRSTQLRLAARLKVRQTKVLSKVPIFASIPAYRMEQAIATILGKTVYKRHVKQDVLCKQGELANDFFIIVSGQCSVQVTTYNSQDGNTVTRRVGTLKELEFFGESALLGGMNDLTRNATITVESDYVQVLVLSRLRFQSLVEEGVITKDVTSTLAAENAKRMKSNSIVSRSSFVLPVPPPPPPKQKEQKEQNE